ncbi:ABC transporter substrate-binding protein [Anatilimnocola floriformis]|uniref:ABC transporter substrate-binding protein n=1 Tax=Anatilimnocola floriformis TaxID=2948575 RepID=UPI0020C570FF|nr:ABC transporter substrate-binding protein [Anatilimnocola floriformis]
MSHPRWLVFSLVIASLAVAVGCDFGGDEETTAEFKLGDLVKPFDPPPLAELDAKADWQDRPVLDGLVLLREKQAAEQPLATVAEALALKNVGTAENDRILSALGRLPTDDKQVNFDAEIVRHSNFEVKSTNPLLSSSVTESDISGLTGFGLFGFDWNFKPFASKDSVVSWQTSKDGLFEKVILRNDLVWSDGKPITAHDVEFSYKLIMTEKVPVPAVRSGTDKLKYVKAYDDHTVIFFHPESAATNVWNINFPVVPKHVYDKPKELAADPTLQNSDYWVSTEKSPVAGGAYLFSKRTLGQGAVLERRDDYFMHKGKQVRDKPYFKTIRFKFVKDPSASLLQLKGGDLDEMILTPLQWLKESDDDEFYRKNTKARGIEWTSFHFIWNMKVPLFADKRVRWAMSYAMDHKQMLEKNRYGLDEPCNGMFHPTSRWAPKNPPQFIQQDLAKAKELLKEAGWEDSNGDGILDKEINGKRENFDFGIIVADRPDRIELCTILKQSLEKIGIRCTVKPTEFSVLQDKLLKKEFQAAFGGWGTGADPDTSVNIWGSTGERNYGSYVNPEIDQLFEAGRKEFDDEKRAEIYGKIHMLAWEDQPYTWLYYQNAYYGFSKELRGYMFSPRGPYHYSPGFGSIYRAAE